MNKTTLFVSVLVLALAGCAHMRDISLATAQQISEGQPAALTQNPFSQRVIVNQPYLQYGGAYGYSAAYFASACNSDPVLCGMLRAQGGIVTSPTVGQALYVGSVYRDAANGAGVTLNAVNAGLGARLQNLEGGIGRIEAKQEANFQYMEAIDGAVREHGGSNAPVEIPAE